MEVRQYFARNLKSNGKAELTVNQVRDFALVDYKKAFDLIDHQLLLHKLHIYGIRGDELNLLQNYLSNHWQYVDIDGFCSLSIEVKSGVPQGSVFGSYPLSFVY